MIRLPSPRKIGARTRFRHATSVGHCGPPYSTRAFVRPTDAIGRSGCRGGVPGGPELIQKLLVPKLSATVSLARLALLKSEFIVFVSARMDAAENTGLFIRAC